MNNFNLGDGGEINFFWVDEKKKYFEWVYVNKNYYVKFYFLML